jgi:hypothetical protein
VDSRPEVRVEVEESRVSEETDLGIRFNSQQRRKHSAMKDKAPKYRPEESSRGPTLCMRVRIGLGEVTKG